MNRIKVVGGLVLFFSIVLVLLYTHITTQNIVNNRILTFLNEQKAFTQEISKSIFYTYRDVDIYENNNSKSLDETIKRYIENSKIESIESNDKYNNPIIIRLWNLFYADVQKFRTQQRISTGYNPIITAKLVNRIYHNNVLLINEFDKIIHFNQHKYEDDIEEYKKIEYALFTILILLLIYLFTKIGEIIAFVQKFTNASKNIIQNSTIKGLVPIKESKQEELREAIDNYNHFVEKINSSIEYSTKSISQSQKSLEEVARNIEEFMELLSTMQDKESQELFEKEDTVIDSLETIMKLRGRLGSLKNDLNRLLSVKKDIKSKKNT